MKRRMATLAALATLAGIMTVFVPSSPTQAAVHAVCAGTGNAHLSAPLFYPVNPTTTTIPLSPRSANFTFHLNGLAAACVTVPGATVTGGPSATGTVHGWCGFSVGSGTVTGGGQAFSWIGIGSMLVVTGNATGVVNASPNLVAGDSCVSGADDFIITGVAVLTSCETGTSVSSSTSTPDGSVSASSPDSAVHASGHAVNGKLHAHAWACF
jgi:hypothetical protein